MIVSEVMKSKKQERVIRKTLTTHEIWHRFSDWLVKTYGKDLHGKWEYMKISDTKKLRYRSFNDLELSRRLVGYDVLIRIERYVKRYCPEIKVLRVDDECHSGSDLLLIPHPKMGITVIFIPQCTSIQNQFFLYEGHHKALSKALKKMKWVYRDSI